MFISQFESKMTMKGADFDDIKQKFRSELEKNFEMEFIEFQVKNKEKKVALVSSMKFKIRKNYTIFFFFF